MQCAEPAVKELERELSLAMPALASSASEPRAVVVGDAHGFGACGKLDFDHRQPRALNAIPEVVVDFVVDDGRAIACQLNLPAFALWVKAVAQQRNHGMQMGQLLHVLKMRNAMPH